MSKFVPCGRTLGHGDRCTDRFEGGLCDHCVHIMKLEKVAAAAQEVVTWGDSYSYLEKELADALEAAGYLGKQEEPI